VPWGAWIQLYWKEEKEGQEGKKAKAGGSKDKKDKKEKKEKKEKKDKKEKKSKVPFDPTIPAHINQKKIAYADVIMFSGCKDEQVSMDTNVAGFGATGAMSYSFITAFEKHKGQPTYTQLLSSMRSILKEKRFAQVPQLSTAHPMDLNTNFIM